MKSETRNHRVTIIILILSAVSTIIYLFSIKNAFPVFQNARLTDPLAELHSLFPLYYTAIAIIALLGVVCFLYRIENKGIHLLLLLLMAIMLWYTPYYLAEFARPPDAPRNVGVAMVIPQVLQGIQVLASDYAMDYPTSYILDYTLLNLTKIDYLSYMHLFPFLSIVIFVILFYAFTSQLFNPRAAFIAVLFAIPGLHYIVFHPSAHLVGVLLLMTALILLLRRDVASTVFAFLSIIAVVICHPISPILLAVFLAAAFVAFFSRRLAKSQALLGLMILVCMGGWFFWPNLTLTTGETTQPSVVEEPGTGEAISEWSKEVESNIFPSEFETTREFLLGSPFIYKGIYNINRGIYLLYAFLAAIGFCYVLYRSRPLWKRPRDFIKEIFGLRREEVFMAISVPVLVILTILLAERGHVLIERSLSFIIIAMSGFIASILTRIYEPGMVLVKRFIGVAMVVVLLFLTLSFPVVAYSIDAYTSFPISEEAGLKFLADHVPLDTKTLATTSGSQMTLYGSHILAPVALRDPSSLEDGDVFAFRSTGYYHVAMRDELSFHDNWFTRYQSAVSSSNEFDRIYCSQTTTIFSRRD